MQSINFNFSQDGSLKLTGKKSEPSINLNYKDTNFQAKFIEKKRNTTNLTFREVAELLGFNNITKTEKIVAALEQSECDIPKEYREKLFKIYNITEAEFRWATSDKNPDNAEIVEYNRAIDKALTDKKLALIDALPTLFHYIDEFKSIDSLYFIELEDTVFSSAYIGNSKIYLGDLLTLWQKGEWQDRCSNCGGIRYAFSAGGSPLSGSGSGWGVCSGCRQNVTQIKPCHFGSYYLFPYRKNRNWAKPDNLNVGTLENVLEIANRIKINDENIEGRI